MSAKRRGQFLVNLCTKKRKHDVGLDPDAVSSNPLVHNVCSIGALNPLQDTSAIVWTPDDELMQVITPILRENSPEISFSNVDISENDLHHSVQFQDSRCSQVFSYVDSEVTINTSPPAVELVEETKPDENIAEGNNAPNSRDIQLEDPDYIPETNDKVIEPESGRPRRGRKRKHLDQNRSIRKKRANNNENYTSAKGKEVRSKEFSGNDFNCRCKLKCTEKLSVEERKNEFQRFWSAGSYEARCALLQGYVRESEKNRSYSVNSKRLFTRKYYLLNQLVCKKAFLNTIGISQTRIDFALQKLRTQSSIKDKRGVNSGGKNAISQDQLQEMKSFFASLPKYSSHYCRGNTTSNFLAPNLNLALLYDLYKEKYDKGVSFSRFRKCFHNDFNLRFKKPQKDTCLRCDMFKAKQSSLDGEQLTVLEAQHKAHLDHAYELRDQMKKDLALAKTDSSLETLTFDLEKTHCLPRLPTSIVYYKRQLNLHNLGVHCGSTGKGYFYIWLEHEAGRGTQEVGSCLQKFITTNLKPTATHLILWADSCGGQNRSIKMVLMLLFNLLKHATLQKITLRFLQPGHTYLPNDSEFGDVECALKTQTRLYTPDDYVKVMKNCRRKNKFIVTRLTKEDFLSVAPIQERITNRKLDLTKQKVSWLNTFEIELRRNDPMKLYMKSKLQNDPNLVDISKGTKGRKTKPNFDFVLPILYPEGRQLSDAKIKDLKEMMKLIPLDAKPFYNFLKTVPSNDFLDDADGFGNTIDFEIEEDVSHGDDEI